jgi:hypothetical protein
MVCTAQPCDIPSETEAALASLTWRIPSPQQDKLEEFAFLSKGGQGSDWQPRLARKIIMCEGVDATGWRVWLQGQSRQLASEEKLTNLKRTTKKIIKLVTGKRDNFVPGEIRI